MKYHVVTTFPEKFFELYGKRMVETFDKMWSKTLVQIHVYTEGNVPQIGSNRVVYHDLMKVPGMSEFKERHKNDPVVNGQPDSKAIPNGYKRPKGYKEKWINRECYLWNAVRFSHKVYAQVDALKKLDGDKLFWFDADTITFNKVNEEAIHKFLPDGYFCSYLGRKTYTECGFIGYNLKHEHVHEFSSRWESMYNDDTLFKLDQWTDCHTFDKVRMDMEQENLIKNLNLNPTEIKGHPFINSVLGGFIDHLKGKRKNTGRSSKTQLQVNRNEDYWK